ncbi:hypothetical protein KFK09_015035 [Dendrobium nobile]|uniref:Uncharacterized protein n=1 Tax=Dendrobium nobile TaxID=94219 RepID=A0A8T3B4R9_DENNO|nr:hypothetical protein KFK09_015035 [Dendrobium nobile]
MGRFSGLPRILKQGLGFRKSSYLHGVVVADTWIEGSLAYLVVGVAPVAPPTTLNKGVHGQTTDSTRWSREKVTFTAEQLPLWLPIQNVATPNPTVREGRSGELSRTAEKRPKKQRKGEGNFTAGGSCSCFRSYCRNFRSKQEGKSERSEVFDHEGSKEARGLGQGSDFWIGTALASDWSRRRESGGTRE